MSSQYTETTAGRINQHSVKLEGADSASEAPSDGIRPRGIEQIGDDGGEIVVPQSPPVGVEQL